LVSSKLKTEIPILVDEMDNAVWKSYGAAPNAVFYINGKGKVGFRQDWFDPIKFEQKLVEALAEEKARW